MKPFSEKFFSAMCHRRPERSISAGGRQMVFCARCSAIYISFTAVLLFVLLSQGLGIGVSHLLFFVMLAPMAIDGALQFFELRQSSNKTRWATGVLAGSAIALFYSRAISDALSMPIAPPQFVPTFILLLSLSSSFYPISRSNRLLRATDQMAIAGAALMVLILAVLFVSLLAAKL